ncbi:MAG: serine O-acetyltransferase [Phycisphaerae bacterium]
MDPRHLGESLPSLVDRLVESYFSDQRTHHVDKTFLPSKAGIVRICDLLLELNYPGYFGRQGLTRHNISYHVGELVPRLWEQLCTEIAQCLCHDAEECGDLPADQTRSPERAIQLADEFLKRMPAVRAQLAEDVQAHYDGDPAAESTSEIILAYPGMLAITIYRYAHELYSLDVPKIPRIMTEHAHQLTGVDIHPGARIGRSFCIDHATGVVIGETTEIGDNVKIYQGVTLGALSFPKDERGRLIRGHKRHPTVGNNVTIYANATILGGDTVIGDGAVIGGSVFLTKSVAPGHQVTLGAPVLKVRPPRPARHPEKPTPEDFVPDYVI